jgi:hypothetical protein
VKDRLAIEGLSVPKKTRQKQGTLNKIPECALIRELRRAQLSLRLEPGEHVVLVDDALGTSYIRAFLSYLRALENEVRYL